MHDRVYLLNSISYYHHIMILIYLVFQTAKWTNHVIEDVFTHVSINCTKWVIQEVDVSVLIDSPGQRHALLLTAR